MEKSLHLLKLLVPKMSEIVAKYCGGGVAGGIISLLNIQDFWMHQ